MGAYLLENSLNISRQDFQIMIFNFLADFIMKRTWLLEKKVLLNKNICFRKSEIIKKRCTKWETL